MSILKREVLYGVANNITRFSDWAICTTTIGTMVEPFSPNTRRLTGTSIGDFDPSDEVSRIDSMREINIDKESILLSGGEHALIGGYCMPRTGR